MKVTYNWLKEFIDIPVDGKELYNVFHKIGLEVDDFYYQGRNLDNVVVAHVEKLEKHPDADKLSVCQVNNGEETVQIICGAKNVREGAKVICAKIGAVLPGDFKIKKAKLRGVESYGMLCSETELSLAEKSEGIILLPENAEVGTPALDYFQLDDYVYSLETFANRPDHMGVMGIAKDLAVYFDVDFNEKKFDNYVDKAQDEFEIIIENKKSCPRYAGRYITGINNTQSPQYIKNRLIACDVRPIDLLVDITNYVMLETGHPMHAFDADFFPDKKVYIKDFSMKDYETLNEKKYDLENDLVIANSEGPVALAGIIGGANSEVKQSTSHIFFESAYFEPKGIMNTSRRINLKTDSSSRFEKHADVDMVPYAISLATRLLKENMEGIAVYNALDSYPEEIAKVKVEFDRNKVCSYLGCEIKSDLIEKILKRLPVKETESGVFEVEHSRKDLNIPVDFVEEIAKYYGYENIQPKTIKMEFAPYYNKLDKYFRYAHKLSSLGFNEVKNFSLVGKKGVGSPELVNPLTEELRYMRDNMWEGLLKNVEYNSKRGSENHAYFETGKTYDHKEGKFSEENMIAGVLCGNIFEMPGNDVKADYYYIKGIVENVLDTDGLIFERNQEKDFLHPGISAKISKQGEILGYVGKMHPGTDTRYYKDVFYFEFYPEKIEAKGDFKIPTLSIFPSSKFDLSLIVPEKVCYQDVILSMEELNILELESIKFYDFYQGEKIPDGTVSMTFRLKFTHPERTLNDDEINQKVGKILKNLSKIDVSLREQ